MPLVFLVSLASCSVYGARTLGVGFLCCGLGRVIPSCRVCCWLSPACVALLSLGVVRFLVSGISHGASAFGLGLLAFRGLGVLPFFFFLGPLLFRFPLSGFRGFAGLLEVSVGMFVYPLWPSFLALPALLWLGPGVS